ncbi:MAG: putative lipid II flippase FtsW [Spirochaetota bacterium]
MSERFALERIPKKNDVKMALLLVLIVGVGYAVLFSASYNWAEKLYGDPFRLVRRQIFWVGLGSVACFVAYRFPLDLLRRLVPALLLGGVGLMLLTFVPGLSEEYLGARRWIYVFGTSFQPSEFVRVVLVIYLAHILSRKRNQLDDTLNNVVPPLIVVLLFAGLIYIQNDFSTAVFVTSVALAIFFVAGVRLRFFVGLCILTAPLATVLLLTREHRVLRILAFLDPELDRFGSGYQVLAAQRGLANGGLWGRGIGQSVQKYGALPEPHSDFVFAVLGEESGFLGIIAIVLLFAIFAFKGYQIAMTAKDSYLSLLSFGVTSMIVFQALLNMAVVCGLVPATGIPLPFFSHGGTAVFMTLIMVGLLLNVARDGRGEERAELRRESEVIYG